MIVGYAEPTFSLYGNDVSVHWPLSKLLEFDVTTWIGWHSLEVRVRSLQEEFQSHYDLVWVCIEDKTSTLITVPDAMKHNRDFFSLPRNLIPTTPEASQVELSMMLLCFEVNPLCRLEAAPDVSRPLRSWASAQSSILGQAGRNGWRQS